jgi:hypothetical protein
METLSCPFHNRYFGDRNMLTAIRTKLLYKGYAVSRATLSYLAHFPYFEKIEVTSEISLLSLLFFVLYAVHVV